MISKNRNVAVHLFLIALASLAVYIVALVRRYSLQEWWDYPRREIPGLSFDPPKAIWEYAGTVLALFLLYALALRLAGGFHRRRTWAVMVAGAGAFALAMMAAYPFTSVDIFEYIVRGRILAFHGGNPFYDTPSDFTYDRFYQYSAWIWTPSAYGPWWEWLASGLVRLGGQSVVANVLAFKTVNLLAYAGTTLLIGLILRARSPQDAFRGVMLFAWNPMVIIETIGVGHNDILMVLFIVLAFYFLSRGRFTLAALALVGGGLLKFISLMLMPVLVIVALKRLPGWRDRLRYLMVTGAASVAVTVVSYAPFWDGGDIMKLLGAARRTEMYTTSLPTLILSVLANEAEDPVKIMQKLAYVCMLVTAGWLLWQSVRAWRSSDSDGPVRAALSVLLFYLLFTILWFFQWYLIWPLALAALLPRGVMQRGTILFTLSGALKPAFIFLAFGWFTEQKIVIDAGMEKSIREVALSILVMALPWAYFVGYGGLRLWRSVSRLLSPDSSQEEGDVQAVEPPLDQRAYVRAGGISKRSET